MNASIPASALQSAHAERAANDIAAHLHPFTNLAAHPGDAEAVGPLLSGSSAGRL